MSPAEIERLIAEWKDAEVERLEDVRVQHRFDEDQRSLMVDLAIEEHEALDDTLEDNHYARVTGEADALNRKFDLDVPPFRRPRVPLETMVTLIVKYRLSLGDKKPITKSC